MNNRLLLFLETIETSNSISEAAQKLYLTQPYISHVIKKYEQKYNVILIDRNSYPIQITPAGHLLIRHLRKSLQLERQFEVEVHQFQNKHFSTLRMGITPPLGQNFNLTILPKLLKKFPALNTKTIEIGTIEAKKAFKDYQLDLFVGNIIHLPNTECEQIYTDKQVLVLSKNSYLYHPHKKEIQVSSQELQQFNHENFIVVDSQQGYQEIVDNYFYEMGISFYPKIHVRDSITALKLAGKGLGNMSTCLEAVQNTCYSNINYIKLPSDKVKIDFSITTAKTNKSLSLEITYVKNILKKLFISNILVY